MAPGGGGGGSRQVSTSDLLGYFEQVMGGVPTGLRLKHEFIVFEFIGVLRLWKNADLSMDMRVPVAEGFAAILDGCNRAWQGLL